MIPLPETLRIFPLTGVVLFPDTLLPLHVFEPRYRKLLRDALDTDRTIGMVLVKDVERQAGASAAGDAAIYPVGCAGKIVAHEPLPDGRSLVILKGTVRFRIKRELATTEPYRVVEGQALYEASAMADSRAAWRTELESKVQEIPGLGEKAQRQLEGVFRKATPAVLVNTLSASLPLTVLERQSLLECATVEQRFDLLESILEYKLVEASLGLDSDRGADS